MKFLIILSILFYVGNAIAFDDDDHTECVITPKDKEIIVDVMSKMTSTDALSKKWENVFGTPIFVEHVTTFQNSRGLLCRTIRVEVGDRPPVEIDGCDHHRSGWQLN